MSKRKRMLALLMCFLMVILIAVPVATYADDDWEGWTEETIEQAWQVYVVTTWADVESLRFSVSASGSIASADVPDSFRESYESIISGILSDYRYGLIFSSETNTRDKTAYTEIILAMAYTLHQKGVNNFVDVFIDGTVDVCFLSYYVDDSLTFETAEECFEELIRRYYIAEAAYLIYHPTEGASYSIYQNDDYLGAVIQGTIYGRQFVVNYSTYSTDNAAEYYSEYESSLPQKYNNFAAQVAENYSAIRSSMEEYIIG